MLAGDMDTKTLTVIFAAVVGAVFFVIGLFRVSLPRQKRWILAYTALCFFVYGALEYFGVIHLES